MNELELKEIKARCIEQFGTRYQRLMLNSYQSTMKGQLEAVQVMRDVLDAAIKNPTAIPPSLLLYGPCGTGKDHLLSALAFELMQTPWKPMCGRGLNGYSRHAERKGYPILWANGLAMFDNLRDKMDELKAATSSLQRAPVLYISDPVPPSGKLSEWELRQLYNIVDARYRSSLPTWVTVNVRSRGHLEEVLSTKTVDRLLDGAKLISCSWPSYRTSAP